MGTDNRIATIHGKLSTDTTSLTASLNAEIRAGTNQQPETAELTLGHALIWDAEGRLAVDVADEPDADNTRPITSAAVQTALGNIDVLLKTI